jgi:Flp pilus assembly protein TadG
MMGRKLNRFLKCERGTQMIEFALLLPFLIVLFASAVEMGRMFYTYTTLQKSTEVGARYLSSALATGGTYSTSDTNIATNLIVCGVASTAANGCSGQTPIASNQITVGITPPGTAIGTRYVTVKVTYAYQPLVFDLGQMTGVSQLSLNFTFTPTITMRYML